MNDKTPTLKEKTVMYEKFIQKLNEQVVANCLEGIEELTNNASLWCYSQSVGKDELPEKERQKCINRAFWNLCNTTSREQEIDPPQTGYTIKPI